MQRAFCFSFLFDRRGGRGGRLRLFFFRPKKQKRETKQDQISFAASEFRRGVYERVLTKIRLVVITRMAKPEEVLIVEDENGET